AGQRGVVPGAPPLADLRHHVHDVGPAGRPPQDGDGRRAEQQQPDGTPANDPPPAAQREVDEKQTPEQFHRRDQGQQGADHQGRRLTPLTGPEGGQREQQRQAPLPVAQLFEEGKSEQDEDDAGQQRPRREGLVPGAGQQEKGEDQPGQGEEVPQQQGV